MKKRVLKIVLWIIGLALLVGGGYLIYSKYLKEQTKKNAYQTSKATLSNIENLITATGKLQPKDFVEVGTQVSGQLEKIYFEVGDTVQKGELLAQIDVTLYRAKVEGIQAQLEYQIAQRADKNARLKLAILNFERQKELLKSDATSKMEFQNAQSEFESAQAQISMLEAQIKQTLSNLKAEETNLAYTKIYAPMSGTIVSINAKEGQTLNANQQAPIILKIADLSVMSVYAEVSEADITKIHAGMGVYFTTIGSKKKWFSMVNKIEPTPSVTNNVVLYNALFDIENNESTLMSQMTTQVFFVESNASKAVVVPVGAIKFDEHNESLGVVEVLRANQKVDKKKVTIGVKNRIEAQILSGIKVGEEVILPNTQKELDQEAKAKKSKNASGAKPPMMGM